jgi:hypothetical protein
MITIFCTVVLSVIQRVALNTGVLPFSKGRALQQAGEGRAAGNRSSSPWGRPGAGRGLLVGCVLGCRSGLSIYNDIVLLPPSSL